MIKRGRLQRGYALCSFFKSSSFSSSASSSSPSLSSPSLRDSDSTPESSASSERIDWTIKSLPFMNPSVPSELRMETKASFFDTYLMIYLFILHRDRKSPFLSHFLLELQQFVCVYQALCLVF